MKNAHKEKSVESLTETERECRLSLQNELFHKPGKVSKIAKRLHELKKSSFKAASSRERLPHPLFWSLLETELEEVRQSRKKRNELRKRLFGIEIPS